MKLCKVVRLGDAFLRRLSVCVLGGIAMLNMGPTSATTLSMLISLAVYAAAFGMKFATGFIILLTFHEMGHLLASRTVGLGVMPPLFIPFIGAVIRLKHPPHNAKMEANIAIGGPALGTLSTLIFLVLHFWTESLLMLVLAYTGCLLNLFNLIPCDPLDGGRIAAAISTRLWWAGSLMIAALFFYTHNIFILIIFICSLFRLWSHGGEEPDKCYYCLPIRTKWTVAVWYFGLLLVLGIATLYIAHSLH
jgi:Zn-dependent protease